jgi:hypothetical protein
MACERIRERLVTLLYDEPDAGERAELKRHLAACPACAAELESLAATRGLLADARPDAPPLAPRVLVLSPRPMQRPWLAFAAGVICALLLVGGGAALGVGIAGPTPADGVQLAAGPTLPPEDIDRSPEAVGAVSPVELQQTLFDYRNQVDRVSQDNDRILDLLRNYDSRFETYETDRSNLSRELAQVTRVLDLRRAADVDMLLSEIAAAEYRANDRIGKTEETFRYIVLSANPSLSEQ